MKFSPSPTTRVLLGSAFVLGLSACSMFESDRIDYKSAGRGVSLEVPPDLTQLPDESRYSIKHDSVSATEYEAGRATQSSTRPTTAPNAIADVQFERSGNERWLHVARPADELWDSVRDFWLENGFLIAVDQSRTGIMETDWAENRAKIPQDIIRRTIGKVFDSLYSTGERDKFRTRVERNLNGGTDIFVTHRGMEEVYSSSQKDSTIWQPRERDPELENEFLRRLMVKLGVNKEKADAAVASAATAAESGVRTAQATAATVGGQPAVQVADDFARTWRRVGLALDRTGFTVEDRDRSQGIYYVRYVDPTAEKKKPGFFSKLLGGSSAPLPTRQYQIHVHEETGSTLVSVQGDSGQPVDANDAQRIMHALLEELQ